MVFEPQAPKRAKRGTGPFSIEALIRFVRTPDLHEFAPFVDRYGQCRHADWPGTLSLTWTLPRMVHEEDRRLAAWGDPSGYDRFGGCKLAGWTEKPTGFFRVGKKGAFWWLISPEGNPCFYVGLCTVPQLQWETTPVTGREFLFEWLPPKDGQYKAAWRQGAWGGDSKIEYVAMHTVNLIRKFGDDWKKSSLDLAARRLKAWGFSGVGKWGKMEGMPYVPVLWGPDVASLAGHPDVFDADVCAKFKEWLKKEIEPHRDDPCALGGRWATSSRRSSPRARIPEILKKPGDVPARRELIRRVLGANYAGKLDNLPDADIESMRRHYARAYYRFIYRTIKQIDPNHLYFGFWITPGWWVSEEDWRLISSNCDVIGYDLYSFDFADTMLERLMKESNKPVLLGEFSFPAFYAGQRGFGVYSAFADHEADSRSALCATHGGGGEEFRLRRRYVVPLPRPAAYGPRR